MQLESPRSRSNRLCSIRSRPNRSKSAFPSRLMRLHCHIWRKKKHFPSTYFFALLRLVRAFPSISQTVARRHCIVKRKFLWNLHRWPRKIVQHIRCVREQWSFLRLSTGDDQEDFWCIVKVTELGTATIYAHSKQKLSENKSEWSASGSIKVRCESMMCRWPCQSSAIFFHRKVVFVRRSKSTGIKFFPLAR